MTPEDSESFKELKQWSAKNGWTIIEKWSLNLSIKNQSTEEEFIQALLSKNSQKIIETMPDNLDTLLMGRPYWHWMVSALGVDEFVVQVRVGMLEKWFASALINKMPNISKKSDEWVSPLVEAFFRRYERFPKAVEGYLEHTVHAQDSHLIFELENNWLWIKLYVDHVPANDPLMEKVMAKWLGSPSIHWWVVTQSNQDEYEKLIHRYPMSPQASVWSWLEWMTESLQKFGRMVEKTMEQGSWRLEVFNRWLEQDWGMLIGKPVGRGWFESLKKASQEKSLHAFGINEEVLRASPWERFVARRITASDAWVNPDCFNKSWLGGAYTKEISEDLIGDWVWSLQSESPSWLTTGVKQCILLSQWARLQKGDSIHGYLYAAHRTGCIPMPSDPAKKISAQYRSWSKADIKEYGHHEERPSDAYVLRSLHRALEAGVCDGKSYPWIIQKLSRQLPESTNSKFYGDVDRLISAIDKKRWKLEQERGLDEDEIQKSPKMRL